jgi:hypothetical protein
MVIQQFTDLLELPRRLFGSDRGNVVLELAVITPVVMLLLAGGVEFGRVGMEHLRLSSAARAGAQYGIQDFSTSGDIDGIVAAARADAGDTDGLLNVAAQQVCRCPGNDDVVDCAISCPDGEFAPMFVEVAVSDEVDLRFTFPGVPESLSVAASSSIRVR